MWDSSFLHKENTMSYTERIQELHNTGFLDSLVGTDLLMTNELKEVIPSEKMMTDLGGNARVFIPTIKEVKFNITPMPTTEEMEAMAVIYVESEGETEPEAPTRSMAHIDEISGYLDTFVASVNTIIASGDKDPKNIYILDIGGAFSLSHSLCGELTLDIADCESISIMPLEIIRNDNVIEKRNTYSVESNGDTMLISYIDEDNSGIFDRYRLFTTVDPFDDMTPSTITYSVVNEFPTPVVLGTMNSGMVERIIVRDDMNVLNVIDSNNNIAYKTLDITCNGYGSMLKIKTDNVLLGSISMKGSYISHFGVTNPATLFDGNQSIILNNGEIAKREEALRDLLKVSHHMFMKDSRLILRGSANPDKLYMVTLYPYSTIDGSEIGLLTNHMEQSTMIVGVSSSVNVSNTDMYVIDGEKAGGTIYFRGEKDVVEKLIADFRPTNAITGIDTIPGCFKKGSSFKPGIDMKAYVKPNEAVKNIGLVDGTYPVCNLGLNIACSSIKINFMNYAFFNIEPLSKYAEKSCDFISVTAALRTSVRCDASETATYEMCVNSVAYASRPIAGVKVMKCNNFSVIEAGKLKVMTENAPIITVNNSNMIQLYGDICRNVTDTMLKLNIISSDNTILSSMFSNRGITISAFTSHGVYLHKTYAPYIKMIHRSKKSDALMIQGCKTSGSITVEHMKSSEEECAFTLTLKNSRASGDLRLSGISNLIIDTPLRTLNGNVQGMTDFDRVSHTIVNDANQSDATPMNVTVNSNVRCIDARLVGEGFGDVVFNGIATCVDKSYLQKTFATILTAQPTALLDNYLMKFNNRLLMDCKSITTLTAKNAWLATKTLRGVTVATADLHTCIPDRYLVLRVAKVKTKYFMVHEGSICMFVPFDSVRPTDKMPTRLAVMIASESKVPTMLDVDMHNTIIDRSAKVGCDETDPPLTIVKPIKCKINNVMSNFFSENTKTSVDILVIPHEVDQVSRIAIMPAHKSCRYEIHGGHHPILTECRVARKLQGKEVTMQTVFSEEQIRAAKTTLLVEGGSMSVLPDKLTTNTVEHQRQLTKAAKIMME